MYCLKYLLGTLLILLKIYSFGQPQFYSLERPDRAITIKDGLVSNKVYGCIQDQEGFMWFYTDRGLSKYDGHRFKNFTVEDGLPINDIWLISIDSLNRKWLHCHDRSICYIENDKVCKATDLSDIYSFLTLILDANGNMICFEPNYKFMLKLSNKQYTFVNLLPEQQNHPFADYFSLLGMYFKISGKMDTLYTFDSQNNLYSIALNNKNIFRSPVVYKDMVYFSSNEGLYVFQKKKFISQYKINNISSINRVFKDQQENIWVTTKDKGVLVYYNARKKISKKTIPNKIPLSRTIPFNQSTLYIDQEHNVLSFNLKELNFTKKYQLPGVRIVASFLNNYEIIQTDATSYYVDVNNSNQFGDLSNISSKFPGLKNIPIIAQAQPYCENSIIEVFGNRRAKQLQQVGPQFIEREFHVDNEKIQFTYVDSKQNIYLFSKFFVFRFDADFQKIDSASLMHNQKPLSISCVEEDTSRNSLWIGTHGQGLFELKQNRLEQKIGNTGIKKIIQSVDKLFYSNDNGVFVYSKLPEKLTFLKAFTSSDGIFVDELIDIQVKADTLVTILRKEIILFDISNIPNWKDSLYIYSFQIDGSSRNLYENPTLPYSFKQLTIQFSLMNYNYVNEVQYTYSLNDQNIWIPLESNQINFQALSNGDYTLNVKAENRYTGTELGRNQIQFSVAKPWWRTYTFLLLVNSLLLLVLFYFYKRWIHKKNENRNKVMTMELALKELKLKALESQMNPHFIYNSLASIQYYIQANLREEAEHYLTSFSKLIRSYLEATRKPTIKLHDEIILLTQYLSLEKLRYEGKFTYEIKVDPKINTKETEINSMLLQPFVENAIQHGLFHRKKNGFIKISFKRENNDLVVSIIDNGIGIEKSLSLKKNMKNMVNSHALNIFHEKLEIINKIHPNSLSYSHANLDEAEEEYKGTIIQIVFKNCLDI